VAQKTIVIEIPLAGKLAQLVRISSV